jgi:hypothetical protein
VRALLTEQERAVLGGTVDASENYRTTVRSRVRKRLAALEEDIAVLSRHEPTVCAELRAIVCDD